MQYKRTDNYRHNFKKRNSLQRLECRRPRSFSNVSVYVSRHKSVTPRSRNLPEKLKVPQVVTKFPAIHVGPSSITAITIARHLCLTLSTPINEQLGKF
jgi:hypothetical protein